MCLGRSKWLFSTSNCCNLVAVFSFGLCVLDFAEWFFVPCSVSFSFLLWVFAPKRVDSGTEDCRTFLFVCLRHRKLHGIKTKRKTQTELETKQMAGIICIANKYFDIWIGSALLCFYCSCSQRCQSNGVMCWCRGNSGLTWIRYARHFDGHWWPEAIPATALKQSPSFSTRKVLHTEERHAMYVHVQFRALKWHQRNEHAPPFNTGDN